MPTLLERIKTATQILVGREIHATTIPMPPSISMYSYNGIPHTFKPEKSLEMYGENPWLFASVNAIALEASRIPLKLVIEHDDNEIEEIKEHFKDVKNIFHIDGVTIEYDDWWFNLRASNTEPLVRLNIEAKTKKLLKQKRNSKTTNTN